MVIGCSIVSAENLFPGAIRVVMYTDIVNANVPRRIRARWVLNGYKTDVDVYLQDRIKYVGEHYVKFKRVLESLSIKTYKYWMEDFLADIEPPCVF